MSFPMAPTLSAISEATERSESGHTQSYEPVVIPDTSRYSENYYATGVPYVPRASIFSSETSYGEPLPPGQSTFRNLGLGVPLSHYDKSLPSLPPSSVIAPSASARSGQKTESGRGSVARSDVSRHSAPKSEASRHSITKSPQPSRNSIAKSPQLSLRSMEKQDSLQDFVAEPESPGKVRSAKHSATKSAASKHSATNSTSSRSSSLSQSSGPIVAMPVSPSSPPLPPLPERSGTNSISTVSTHSSSHPSTHSRTSSRSSSLSSSRPTSVSSASTQGTLRTFDDVVDEVATSLAMRAKMRAETMSTSDRTKIWVCATMSRGDDQGFMRILAAKMHQSMALHSSWLFALMPSGPSPAPGHQTLVFCGAPQSFVTRASILAGLRFKTRLAELQDTAGVWIGQLEPSWQGDAWDPSAHHEDVVWDILRKAASPSNPTDPPPGSRGIERILSDARARLDRLSPTEAFAEAMRDGILVDIRPALQRAEHGTIPGALIIERNVLEWRFDPRSVDGRLPIADRYDLRIIVYCQEGYTSSLAAAALQDIGLWQATDIDGGFSRWKNEGFPVNDHPVDVITADHRTMSPTTPPRYDAITME